MQFLSEQFIFSLREGSSKTDTFAVDVSQTRPDFDHIAAFHEWSTEAREKMQKAIERPACPAAWVAIVVDECGILLVLRFQQYIQPSNAKSAAKCLLRCLPDWQTGNWDDFVDALRPLDELDKNRIAAWKTAADLRPKVAKRKRDESSEEDEPPAKRSAAELLAELSSDSEEEDAPWAAAPRLALTNSAHSSAPNLSDTAGCWQARAEQLATIIVAEAGERPECLPYIRCHREKRRELLLKAKVETEWENPTLLRFVQAAMDLAKEGSLPGPPFKHGGRAEFLCRCAAALLRSNPRAEGNISKLSAEEQERIRHALGGAAPPYEGCFNRECLDKEPKWITKTISLPLPKGRREDATRSRCAHCGFLKAAGRTFHSLSDLLRAKDQVRAFNGF